MSLSLTRPGPRLSERTTLGLGGPCLAEVVLRREADLDELAGLLAREPEGRVLVLGGGSNLLAADHELPLVLVRPANADFRILDRAPDADAVTVRAGAGLKLPILLHELARAGLSGLEGLTGIPGNVGGSVAGNAGSFGCCLGERVRRVRLWTPGGDLAWKTAHEVAFAYRHFDPRLDRAPWLVWEVELDLAPSDDAAVRARMVEVMERKQLSQPVSCRTAGCVFKNPEGDFAGRLLEQAGFKGRRLGDMAFSDRHANFLVNLGGGTAAQALELLELARATVLDRSGVRLETEVVVIA
ncbi:MAG: UDP-N-acetylmuramate dehydrogenase [Desulfovibrionaceae bacterium]